MRFPGSENTCRTEEPPGPDLVLGLPGFIVLYPPDLGTYNYLSKLLT